MQGKRNAFNFFTKATCQSLASAREAGAQWQRLTAAEKLPYQQQAVDDQARHKREKAAEQQAALSAATATQPRRETTAQRIARESREFWVEFGDMSSDSESE